MIVNYFNVQRIAVFPAKADSPLIVDPYTVLSLAVAFQGFKTVSGRNPKILQLDCTVQIKQFASCNPFNTSKSSDVPVIEKCLCIFAMERTNHATKLLRKA